MIIFPNTRPVAAAALIMNHAKVLSAGVLLYGLLAVPFGLDISIVLPSFILLFLAIFGIVTTALLLPLRNRLAGIPFGKGPHAPIKNSVMEIFAHACAVGVSLASIGLSIMIMTSSVEF